MPIFKKIPMGEVGSTEAPGKITLFDAAAKKLRGAENSTWS